MFRVVDGGKTACTPFFDVEDEDFVKTANSPARIRTIGLVPVLGRERAKANIYANVASEQSAAVIAMLETDKVFAGSIPENYDRYMVPLIFEPFATDLAQRAAALSPSAVLETAWDRYPRFGAKTASGL